MKIRQVTRADWSDWLWMRAELWPEATAEQHLREMEEIFSDQTKTEVLIATQDPDERPVGFLEGSLRPYADGCETRPVGYIEGWYVDPEFRQSGVGKKLVKAAEAWAKDQGCHEMASDCLIDNQVSLRAHLASGYTEVERCIHFKKWLE